MSCPKDYEDFIKNIVTCEECKAIIQSHGNYRYICEPFRLPCFPKVVDAEVMFLGLSPGTPDEKDKNPPRGTKDIAKISEFCGKKLWPRYDTNFKNAMRERIGKELSYVKANVVHFVCRKKTALKCLEICGEKFLQGLIELFRRSLKYVIVYDWDDGHVLNFVNKKYGIELNLDKHFTADKGIKVNGITFIAARRKGPRYIERLHRKHDVAEVL